MLQGECSFTITGNVLSIEAGPKTDYFVNPIDGKIVANAAFVYQETMGDFVCKAKVSLDHKAEFDGGALFVYQDDTHWVKACFELSSYTFAEVCTVMTNGLSDDCNGFIITGNEVWLQIARTNDVFSIHFSHDGKNYIMARISSMPFNSNLKVGFLAQSPTGSGCHCTFTDFSIENKTISNPRMGI